MTDSSPDVSGQPCFQVSTWLTARHQIRFQGLGRTKPKGVGGCWGSTVDRVEGDHESSSSSLGFQPCFRNPCPSRVYGPTRQERRLLTMSSEQKQKGFKETVQQRQKSRSVWLLAPAFTTGSPARHLIPQLPS